MWCERVIRNAAESAAEAARTGRTVDVLEIEWHECNRVLKKRTRGGESICVLLPRGRVLQHGDILYEDEQRLVIVEVMPCEIVVVRVDEQRQLAVLALELGNLHLPVAVAAGEIAFVEAAPATTVLEAMGLKATRVIRRFTPEPLLSSPKVDVAGQLQLTLRPGGGREPDQSLPDDWRARRSSESIA